MNAAVHYLHLAEPIADTGPRASEHFCYCCWGKRNQVATHCDACFDTQIPCCNDCAQNPQRTCRMPIGSLRAIH